MTTPLPPPTRADPPWASWPPLVGKTALITGASTGIGRAAALQLAERGARVLLACRSEQRGRPALEQITRQHGPDRAQLVELDLSRLASVRAAAAQILQQAPRLDLLLNNAGVAGSRGLTSDGFELTFGVNHLGHFLLTTLLLPALRAAAPARVVNLSSRAHYSARGIDFEALRQRTRSFTGLPEYAVSKLCNVLFTRGLARRLAGEAITSFAVHPGVVASDIWRRLPAPARFIATRFMISNEEGARRVLYCAVQPGLEPASGSYFDNYRQRAANPVADDVALADRLWQQSAAWTTIAPG